MLWLSILCGFLILMILALSIKTALLHRAVDEIRTGLDERLKHDTNTLITISGNDRHAKALAADINVQLRLLRKERRRLQNGDLKLKEAITNISHDLRTPLTAIWGYLDLLEQEETSETVTRYLSVIKNRTEALKQLTEELFRYSVTVSVSEDLIYENLALNHVLEESISAYYAALKSHHITPEILIPERKVYRTLDRNALTRIFGNILSNAIKYSDGDLKITLSKDGVIVFSNRALQLDEVQVGKLFDRFYTVETARDATGLGLSIAKALTEQMNGMIAAQYVDGLVSISIAFHASGTESTQ